MKDILLEAASNESVIHCGAGAFETYAPELKKRYKLFIVTDANVFAIYRHLLWKTFGNDVPIEILVAGEKSKNRANLFKILDKMIASGIKRNDCVVAFGGGVIGDISGLAASLYMRGVHLVQIPTTLLSQVDSSVGGKTAIDMGKVKNAVGTFYQPEEVIVDPIFLSTLPPREIRCGLGEIIKYGALDKEIFEKLIENESRLTDSAFLDEITYLCIKHKAKVVSEDERDLSGKRKTLNLGHTTGHALELKFGKKSHGEFVLIGAFYELFIAKSMGICPNEYALKLEKLILRVLGKVSAYGELDEVASLACHDKKNEKAGVINIIAPKTYGESCEINLTVPEYIAYMENCGNILAGEKVKKLGVVGVDVSKSVSPQMHSFIAKKMGNKIIYDKISLSEDEFDKKIEQLKNSYDGLNVTIPYKLKVIPHLKSIVGDAETFGAVNTVNCLNEKGYNTDGLGFELMLKLNKIDACGKKVLLLGAGGAGRSVAKKLLDGGATVCVYDRNSDNAVALKNEFNPVICLNEIKNEPYYLIINATGVGMHKTVGISPVGAELLSLCQAAVDLIYSPAVSRFLEIAASLGKKTVNGQAMLFYQAYYAQCIYFGVQADEIQAEKLFKEYLKEFEQ